MAVNWSAAPDVAAIAQELIHQHHTHLAELQVRIEYLRRDDQPTRAEKPLMGAVQKITNISAFLCSEDWDSQDAGEPFFVVWIAQPAWSALSAEHRAGLVDHLLCSCQAGRDDAGDVKIRIARPDFEGFYANVRRCGFWQPEAQVMYEAMQNAGQLAIPGLDAVAPLTLLGTGSLEDESLPPADALYRGTCGCEWDEREYGHVCPMHGASRTIDGPAPGYHIADTPADLDPDPPVVPSGTIAPDPNPPEVESTAGAPPAPARSTPQRTRRLRHLQSPPAPESRPRLCTGCSQPLSMPWHSTQDGQWHAHCLPKAPHVPNALLGDTWRAHVDAQRSQDPPEVA